MHIEFSFKHRCAASPSPRVLSVCLWPGEAASASHHPHTQSTSGIESLSFLTVFWVFICCCYSLLCSCSPKDPCAPEHGEDPPRPPPGVQVHAEGSHRGQGRKPRPFLQNRKYLSWTTIMAAVLLSDCFLFAAGCQSVSLSACRVRQRRPTGWWAERVSTNQCLFLQNSSQGRRL